MLKFCVEQWDKNKHKLENNIRNNFESYNNYSYLEIVQRVVELILNEEDNLIGTSFNSSKITFIDNGDYQGTMLFVIPLDTYQPSEFEYLMTYVNYGSCSGCDTLQSIQSWWGRSLFLDEQLDSLEIEKFVKNMMQLCLHLVQNTIKPYNGGWRFDEMYEDNITEK